MPVRRFANEFMKKKMGGRPFMAVHWRYESDWLDMYDSLYYFCAIAV